MADTTITQGGWDQLSPFATTPAPAHLVELHRAGSVRFLLVSGERDDASFGLIGAFWLSEEGDRGGFLLAPESLWQGSEMVRSYRGALARGWTEEQIFRYWESQTGDSGSYMIDPEAEAQNLFHVARRVGAL